MTLPSTRSPASATISNRCARGVRFQRLTTRSALLCTRAMRPSGPKSLIVVGRMTLGERRNDGGQSLLEPEEHKIHDAFGQVARGGCPRSDLDRERIDPRSLADDA